MAWIKIVERKGQSVLISSYFYNGIQTKYFKNSLGLTHGLDSYLIVKYVNYLKIHEVNACVKEITHLLKKTRFAFLKIFFDTFYRKGNYLVRWSRRVGTLPSQDLKQHMCIHFETFSKLCHEFGPAMYFPILVEGIIENVVRDIIYRYKLPQPETYVALFTSSHKQTEGTYELLDLYRIAQKMGAHKVVTKDINVHIERYQWLSYTKFVGDLWTKKSITQRIGDLSRKDIDAEIQELEQHYPKNKKDTAKALKLYNLSKEDSSLVWLAKELAYFRTYRLDVYTKAGFYMRPLFKSIAQEFGITPQELVFLTYEEILQCIRHHTPPDKNIIKQRMEGDWQLKFSHGTMKFKYHDFDIHEDADSSTMECAGRVAYPGKVHGTVKLIRGVLEFGKMQKGDILVTSMTTPDFVPLMEKAAAIVTDEGGITCHAAIVARELKVPCIVGTKIATQILKDGMHVEVDANSGIIKIVTNAYGNNGDFDVCS